MLSIGTPLSIRRSRRRATACPTESAILTRRPCEPRRLTSDGPRGRGDNFFSGGFEELIAAFQALGRGQQGSLRGLFASMRLLFSNRFMTLLLTRDRISTAIRHFRQLPIVPNEWHSLLMHAKFFS
jgi:hypothetical protein